MQFVLNDQGRWIEGVVVVERAAVIIRLGGAVETVFVIAIDMAEEGADAALPGERRRWRR